MRFRRMEEMEEAGMEEVGMEEAAIAGIME